MIYCRIVAFGAIETGVTLAKRGASVTWDPKSDDTDEGLSADRLHIRQLLLGHEAKENEFSVVEVSLNTTTKFIVISLQR